MNNYQKLETTDFDSFYDLMERSFPATERRSKDDAFLIFTSVPCYQKIGLKKDGKVIALLAYWLFDECCFIDHLAVEESLRGQGIGKDLMTYFLQEVKATIVLEVEPPNDDITRKRIIFYENFGFHLNTFPYTQPSMQPGQPEIPMMIMSYPESLTQNQFETIRKRIFHNCYKTK
ncbi:GNAT family N-acetyltransferase [Bacteroidales bacterium OttesenSCG-928-B11]|nr:GNAT family N-acetyltransferase [Bacteroidales bacterium OttesenSCG-928-C03]MDL2313225.1 GNAT family N-acetyltransferase [Bacteroidales bacterium OttesenSCG-928-B11]